MNQVLRRGALKALKNNWQTILMVALIAALPSLIAQVVTIMTGSSYQQAMMNVMLTLEQNATIGDLQQLLDSAGITAAGYIPTVGLSLISAIVSPFLTLGLLNCIFRLLRGETDLAVTDVFSRKECFLKAIGLNMMIGLRVFLWMLPGLAVEMAALALMLAAPESAAGIPMTLMTLAPIVMMVLGVRAAMHYSMATRFMAQTPSMGVNECIRESVNMMSHRKWLLFSLEASFILYYLGITLLESILLEMNMQVIASTASMVLSFVLNVYMQTAISAFYLVCREKPAE